MRCCALLTRFEFTARVFNSRVKKTDYSCMATHVATVDSAQRCNAHGGWELTEKTGVRIAKLRTVEK